MVNVVSLLELLDDENERKEIINELIKINENKAYILKNGSSKKSIDDFIIKTIEKYEDKSEIDSSDEDLEDSYGLLCMIERMITNYVCMAAISSIDTE
jgi:hypothetical protein